MTDTPPTLPRRGPADVVREAVRLAAVRGEVLHLPRRGAQLPDHGGPQRGPAPQGAGHLVSRFPSLLSSPVLPPSLSPFLPPSSVLLCTQNRSMLVHWTSVPLSKMQTTHTRTHCPLLHNHLQDCTLYFTLYIVYIYIISYAYIIFYFLLF